MSAAEESTSSARWDMSPRLPMGVLTRKRVPATLDATLGGGEPPLRGVLLELLRERRLADEADHLVDELPVLEEQDRRDGAYVELGGCLDVGVDIDLRDLGLSLILDCQLIQNRRDHAARRTPRRPEIHDCEALVL